MTSNTKSNLRQQAKEFRLALNNEFVEKASKHACELVISTNEFAQAKSVLIYYPIQNEISPLPLIEASQKAGKTIAFPVCDNSNHSLVFKKANEITDLSKTSFGLYEPQECNETIEIDESTICIVPALVFSKDGHRLGYGKGYYDKFLNSFIGKTIGLSYSALLLENLPNEEHDIPLDIIITESEVLYIA